MPVGKRNLEGFGHFCPSCRAVLRWDDARDWFYCPRCEQARSFVEVSQFVGNQLDADGVCP